MRGQGLGKKTAEITTPHAIARKGGIMFMIKPPKDFGVDMDENPPPL